MLQSCDLIAFVAATDLYRARAFYEEILGLPVIEQTDAACVFDSGGTMLRVAAVATPPRARYTVLGWRVADITDTVRDLTLRGVKFRRFEGMHQDEDGVWTAPDGSRVAWFADLDGNTLSLTQFPR
jgi:catechol 2,3-dioxygenase-like lactoylglutathione lyase family enzyme